jgi:hypothetical protein
VVDDLDRGQCVLAGCARCDSGGALLGHRSDDGSPARSRGAGVRKSGVVELV